MQPSEKTSKLALAAAAISLTSTPALAQSELAPLPSSFEVAVSPVAAPHTGKELIGSWADYSVELSPERPASLSIIPNQLNSPLFGYLRFGQNPDLSLKEAASPAADIDIEAAMGKLWMILDTDAAGIHRLFVDGDRDGKITDLDLIEYETVPEKTRSGVEYTRFRCSVPVKIGTAQDFFMGDIDLYWFDETGFKLREISPVIEASRNYALQGTLPLKTGELPFVINDISLMGDMRGYPVGAESEITLMIDRNENGFFDSRGEEFDLRKPFTINGITYCITDISPSGRKFTLREAELPVPEIPPSPNLSKGQIIPGFTATTIDGAPINFPQDFKDKIIFFDIWATWCGPCVQETPFQKAAFEKFAHEQIVFVSLSIDKPKNFEKLQAYLEEHNLSHPQWLHINDPGGWTGELFQKFATTGIPACFLIDGATGRILSEEHEVRGENLAASIAAEMEKRTPR